MSSENAATVPRGVSNPRIPVGRIQNDVGRSPLHNKEGDGGLRLQVQIAGKSRNVMHRRRMLKWLSGVIATACAAVVAVPGVAYVFSTVRRREASEAIVRRVAPLKVLRPGQPMAMAISGSRQDAWTLYPEELIGRVWLVRKTDDSTPAAQSKVDAFTTVCPHLGCEVQENAGGKGFYCPCHKAKFDANGARVGREQLGLHNPTPRGMDSLECNVVQDTTSGEWWVEVKYEKFEYGLTKKIVRT